MKIQQISFKNNSKTEQKTSSVKASAITTPIDAFEPSTKKDNTKKYIFAGIGFIAIYIALVKHKQIGAFFSNLFKNSEKIARKVDSPSQKPPTTSLELPKLTPPKEGSKSPIDMESKNAEFPKTHLDEPKSEKPEIIEKAQTEIIENIPKLKLSSNTQPIMDYLQKHVFPLKTDGYCGCAYKKLYKKGTSMISHDIIEMLKLAEKEEVIEPKSLINIFKESMQSCVQPPKEFGYTEFQINSKIKGNSAFFNDVTKLIESTPQKTDESISDYFTRIVDVRKIVKQEEELVKQNLIKSKLIYSEDMQDEKIKLTKDDKAEFIAHLKQFSLHIGDVNVIERIQSDHPWTALAYIWNEIATKSTLNIRSKNQNIQRIEKACMQRIFERYKSNNMEPVYRWLHCSDADNVIKDMPNIGESYKYLHFQSCSKNSLKGEEMHDNCELYKNLPSQFNDGYIDSNIKFIIHPKSPTSKAYDKGKTAYGNLEVVYSADTEFRILDKRLVEYENYESPHDEKSFYRWIVEMQEV